MQMDRNTSTEGKDTELLSKFKELFEEITEFSSYKIRNSFYISTLQNKKSYLRLVRIAMSKGYAIL